MANQPPPPKIDRQTTTPFLLKLFYRTGTYHRLDEFSSNPPPHLQIYTWPTCTLRELTHLLLTALPSLLPSPAIGTRLAFRLIYPDTRNSGPGPQGLGRYLSKDLGSVIVTAPPTTSVSAGAQNGSTTHSTNSQDKEGDTGGGGAGAATSTDLKPLLDTLTGDSLKTLQTARFVIGDYISVAIFPPLPDGSVAAAPPPAFHSSSRGPPSSSYNQGSSNTNTYNAIGGNGNSIRLGRENGSGGRPDFGGPRGSDFGSRGDGGPRGEYGGFRGRGGGGFGSRFEGGGGMRGGGGVPPGEWRRGEVPQGGERDGGRGGGGGGGYGRGRGRGRGW